MVKQRTLRLEYLENRVLLSATVGRDELAPMPDSLRIESSGLVRATPRSIGASGAGVEGYSTLANGMPVLHSRPSAPAAIFLDFDGDATTSTDPYDEDGNPTTFNATEADHIAECWRQMSVYYAMFDIDVTTIQPNVSTTPTAWEAIGNNISGGYSYVGVFPNTRAQSWNNSGDARGRVSGIAHEIGHNFGNSHQSTWDLLANKTAEYASGVDTLHGPLMGVDYDGFIHKFILGHPSSSPRALQDDMAVIANKIKSRAPTGYTGDGYAPDDFSNTIATASALPSDGVVQSVVGIIERLTDADAFSFTSGGGRYYVGATRDAPSGVDLKLSIYDTAGNLLASQDGDPRAQPITVVNDQYLSLDLAAGTYYAIVESHGNYADVGQYHLIVSPLPSGWSSQAVGTVGQNAAPGYVSYNPAESTFALAGSGSDMAGTTDSFVFAYQVLQGDGTIVARVASMDNTGSLAQAGVTIRETLALNSKHAAMVMTARNGPQAIWRTSTAGTAGEYHTSGAFTPTWVKLVRSGNTFTGYRSNDGVNWTQWRQTTVAMNSTVYIGLMTCANNQGAINVATFTNVAVTGNLNPGPTLNALAAPDAPNVSAATSNSISLSWHDVAGETGYVIERSSDGVNFTQAGTAAVDATTFTDAGLSGYQRYYYRVRAQDASGVSPPSPAVHAITRAGAVTSFTITSRDTAQLVLNWRDASGETGYRVERSPNGTGNWTALATLGQNVPSHFDSNLTSAATYYYRVVTLDARGDAAVSSIVAASPRLPAVAGLAFTNKTANQMAIRWNDLAAETGYRIERSTDGSAWSTLTTVGINVTTYADNSVAALGEYYYRVVGTNSLTESLMPTPIFSAAPAAAALPAAWQSQDIGSVAGSGAAGLSGATFTLVGGGSDIGGTSDQFRFVHTTLVGDGSITARIASQENTADGAKAGVMMRETLSANSKNAFALITPEDGAAFQYRASAGGGTTSTAGPAVAAPYWVRLSRAGSVFTAEVSADGTAWTTVGTQTISMGATIYMGLAVSSSSSTVLNKSTFSSVSLLSPANTAPTLAAPAAASPNPFTGTATTLSVLGADDGGESRLAYTWAVTTVPPGAPVPTLSGNGTNAAKQVAATFGLSGVYGFTVTMTDAYGLTASGSVSVTVTVPNLPPTDITLSNASVLENQPGAVIGALVAADPNFGDTFIYELVSDPTGRFEIAGATLKVRAGQSFDYETTPNVDLRIRATDNGSLNFEKTFTISVTDVNEPPVVAAASQTVFRNSPAVPLNIAPAVDPDGDAVFVMVTQVPASAQGTISLADGTPVAVGRTLSPAEVAGLRFTPAPGYAGTPAPLKYLAADRNLTTSGLQGYWMLDEGAGSTAADVSGKGSAGTLTNGPVWSAGRFGSALTFDGTNDYVTLGNPAALNFTGQVTIAAWVKPGSINTIQNIVNRGGSSGSADTYLRIYSDATYQAGSNDGATHNTKAAIPPEDLNQWVHLVGVYDGTTWRLYRNGVLASSTASSTGAVDSTNNWAIGSSGNGSRRYLKGAADEVRIYNRGLSAAEVADIYEANVVAGRVDLTVVVNTAPTVAAPAAATPSPAPGTTADLSVLGQDDGGEAALSYTWTATAFPDGAALPTFSANESNAAKQTTVTFSKAGDYELTVTIADPDGLTVSNSLTITVEQTLTSIAVTPDAAELTIGGTQQFSAVAKDQFDDALSEQPVITWSATAGVVDAGGFFTAPYTDATATITAAAGSLSAAATVQALPARTMVWIGGGADGNWTTATNWESGEIPRAGDRLVFGGAQGMLTLNDYPEGTAFRSIAFVGSGFTLGGNAILLAADDAEVIRNEEGVNAITLVVQLVADGTVAVSAGTLTMAGSMDGNGWKLTFATSEGATVDLQGTVLGNGELTQTGGGTLILAGMNTHAGGTRVESGVMLVSGAGALPAGGALSIGSGATLVLGVDLSALPEPTLLAQATAFSVAAAAGSDAAAASPQIAIPPPAAVPRHAEPLRRGKPAWEQAIGFLEFGLPSKKRIPREQAARLQALDWVLTHPR